MRKGNKQQKKNEGKQLKIFNMQTLAPTSPEVDGIEPEQETGVELLSRLKKQHSLTANLLERILDYGNLNKAFKQVKENGGSSGIDQMEIADFRIWMGIHLEKLRESILTGNYKVSAVRKVDIPKPNGGTRMLGIPTVKDRFIQQAIHQELNRHYEPYFSENSYGFRLGRNAHQAILKASEYIKEGKEWIVDIDLEKFF